MIDFTRLSPEAPIRIADHVWWVGTHKPGEPFQCHAYLIEHGDQSVLIDPGAPLGFPQTREKVERIIPFDQIRYFVCHHQDPDITSALPMVDACVTRSDAMILAHWRAIVLLDGYDLRMPLVCVERDLGWRLDLGDRELRFVFTPYAHFPGAFCTFDCRTGVMFSSDLFGGFTEGFSLFAKDESYFECLKPFHEHYIPSREVLVHAVEQMQMQPMKMIAPQHGSIIPEHLVDFFTEKLKTLECGLFLLATTNSDVERLSRLNRTLRDVTKSMIIYRDFRDIVGALLDSVRELLPAIGLEFFARANDGQVLHLGAANRYHGVLMTAPKEVAQCLDSESEKCCECRFSTITWRDDDGIERPAIRVPLAPPEGGRLQGVVIVVLEHPEEVDQHLDILLTRMRQPLAVALEREAIYRLLDMQRQKFYEQSIRDPLTGLFTRLYMNEAVQRFADMHDHDEHAPLALAMIDVDHFKSVNDSYGHAQGDQVLRMVAGAILSAVRSGDIPVRFGGEEFALFTVGSSANAMPSIAERIRKAVSELTFDGALAGRRITVSIGFAIHRQGEEIHALIERADAALYVAKNEGRNQVRRAR